VICLPPPLKSALHYFFIIFALSKKARINNFNAVCMNELMNELEDLFCKCDAIKYDCKKKECQKQLAEQGGRQNIGGQLLLEKRLKEIEVRLCAF
jgi:hypothetical protein